MTLEISNTTPLPAKIYANEGLCQILFFQSDEVCETSYKGSQGQVPCAEGDCVAEAVRAAFSTQPSAFSFQFDRGSLVGLAVEWSANHPRTLRSNSFGAASCAPV